jgi:hypothetical protein
MERQQGYTFPTLTELFAQLGNVFSGPPYSPRQEVYTGILGLGAGGDGPQLGAGGDGTASDLLSLDKGQYSSSFASASVDPLLPRALPLGTALKIDGSLAAFFTTKEGQEAQAGNLAGAAATKPDGLRQRRVYTELEKAQVEQDLKKVRAEKGSRATLGKLTLAQELMVELKGWEAFIDAVDFYRSPTLKNLHNLAMSVLFSYSALSGFRRYAIIGNFISIAYTSLDGDANKVAVHMVVSLVFMMAPVFTTSYVAIPCLLYSSYSAIMSTKNLYDEIFGDQKYVSEIASYQDWINFGLFINAYVPHEFVSAKIQEYEQHINVTKTEFIEHRHALCSASAKLNNDACYAAAMEILNTGDQNTLASELAALKDKAVDNCFNIFESDKKECEAMKQVPLGGVMDPLPTLFLENT